MCQVPLNALFYSRMDASLRRWQSLDTDENTDAVSSWSELGSGLSVASRVQAVLDDWITWPLN